MGSTKERNTSSICDGVNRLRLSIPGVERLQVSHDCFDIGAVSCENRGIGARRGLPLREIEVVSSVIITTLLCI